MEMRSMKSRNFILSVFLLLAAAQAGQAKEKVPFHELPGSWKSDQGDSLQLSRWKGRTVIATLAFTSCKSTCSMIVSKLKKLEASLADARAPLPEIVVFSIDPQVDTPAVMAEFKKRMGVDRKNWHFLSASDKQVRKVSAWLEMGYGEKASTGRIMHTNKIAAIGERGFVDASIDGVDADHEPILDYYTRKPAAAQ
jgi:protein SCO1